VAEGGTTRYVPVRTGLFARGRVEITEGDLRPGQLVVVPR
jgi:multidrug efflux pump subunit AcrA (membrane-fusion protein)